MRYVIELKGATPAVSLQVNPFLGPCREPPRWRGGRVEMTLWEDANSEHSAEVEIEASSIEAMRHVLESALGILEDLESFHKEEAEDHAQNAIPCGHCGSYIDARGPVSHADGRGNICLMDGTALTRMGLERRDGEAWLPVETPAVKGGDTLRWSESACLDDPRWFHAIEDSRRYFDAQAHPPCADWAVRIDRRPDLPEEK